MRYRLRPLEVQAFQWRGDNAHAIPAWVGEFKTWKCGDDQVLSFENHHKEWRDLYPGYWVVMMAPQQLLMMTEKVFDQRVEPYDSPSFAEKKKPGRRVTMAPTLLRWGTDEKNLWLNNRWVGNIEQDVVENGWRAWLGMGNKPGWVGSSVYVSDVKAREVLWNAVIKVLGEGQ